MKILISVLLLSAMAFTGYAVIQTNKRDQVHKTIANLRLELNKVEKEFLSPTPEDFAAYADFLTQPNTGLIRLLPRETYDNPTELTIRGGGAYYSFVRLTHEYGYGSDIELQQNKLMVGFAGRDYGFFTDINGTSLRELTIEHPAAAFMSVPEQQASAYHVRARQAREGAQTGADTISLVQETDATVGHTYLLRSVIPGESDVLVGLRIVRKDDDGSMILAWKMLKRFDTPPR